MIASVTYFMFSEERAAWKIGRTIQISLRMATLMRSTTGAQLCAVFDEEQFPEKKCHSLFRDASIGNEWFQDCDKIREFIHTQKGANLIISPIRDIAEIRMLALSIGMPIKMGQHEDRHITIPLPNRVHRALESRAKINGTSKSWEARQLLISEVAKTVLAK